MIIYKIFRVLVIGIFCLGEVLAQSPGGGNPDSTFICGDVNGDGEVTGRDGSLISWYAIGATEWFFGEIVIEDTLAADVSGNGEITTLDGVLVSQYLNGTRDTLTCNKNNEEDTLGVSGVKMSLVEVIDSLFVVELDLNDMVGDIYTIELRYPERMNLEKAEYMPTGVYYRGNSGTDPKIHTLMNSGGKKIDTPRIIFHYKYKDNLDPPVHATIRFNESPPLQLSELEYASKIGPITLNANYPNPFNPSTLIGYSVLETTNVRLEVFDITGRKVKTLISQRQTPGVYEVYFDGGGGFLPVPIFIV
ncbi:dockerin type I domain-containing protein [Gracilimonas mengyeensis]|uniref:Por secretion system C-terminal sorting domain-containing protein n=1 Tax=Gracilimonas mengyeensis TaxID=1302730 RepID=A0A521AZI6_9BACT|nr:dockerin type I domain-containing protein [Gracilimonas mengyeensis]SMO40264.1 Por secretion system C-terminal sorting domain-containing protein [Gracilimonas mengyeensis]